jgi:small subunit ribosomal protein S17
MPENNKDNDVALSLQPSSSSAVKRLLTVTGVVVSNKMNKTIVVRIDRTTRHSVYQKVTRRSKKVRAHDEKNIAKIGDVVKIVQTRPISKEKRWRLIEVVEGRK